MPGRATLALAVTLLAISACAVPPAQTAAAQTAGAQTAAANTGRRHYEAPPIGSMLGGGSNDDDNRVADPRLVPALGSVNGSGPGGH